jgi:hypothetical protein
MRLGIVTVVLSLAGCTAPSPPDVLVREIEASVDHNHCTTRQFQHMVFHRDGIWFVFYSDGRDFRYQTSADGGVTWQLAEQAVDQAPNGSSSFDLVTSGEHVYLAHSYYPQGRYDTKAAYAKDPSRRHEYTHEGRVKKGRIVGASIQWIADHDPGFTPDYTNLVRDATGHLWVFHRVDNQVVAHRSLQPDNVEDWSPKAICIPVEGRHAPDAAAIGDGLLYVASVLTTDGTLYGNLYDGRQWGAKPVLLSDEMTTVAGDDRRMAMQFDPHRRQLHLVYVDRQGRLLHRRLRAPFGAGDWEPLLTEPPRELATGVFTTALSIDGAGASADLIVVYGLERYTGEDQRVRTGELYARRFDGEQWQGDPILLTQPGTILNWYPNVSPEAGPGLCLLYTCSVNPDSPGQPLAVMTSVVRWGGK